MALLDNLMQCHNIYFYPELNFYFFLDFVLKRVKPSLQSFPLTPNTLKGLKVRWPINV